MHSFRELINKILYDDLVNFQDFSEEEALIATGNGIHLDNRGDLKRQSEAVQRNAGYSLFDLALLYGDLDAIKCLIKAGVFIRTDDAAIKIYLKKLFAEYGRIYDIDSTQNKYDKSVENLVSIYQYLKKTIFKDNSTWSNPKMINSLLADIAQGLETSPLQALLELNLIDDVNVIDKSGKTVLYYLLNNKNIDSDSNSKSVIDDLKKRGAKLSETDNLAFGQEVFAKDFQEAIKDKKPMLKDFLAKISHDSQALSPELFIACLNVAISHDDVETVKSMLHSGYSRSINLNLIDHPKSNEMAFIIAADCEKYADFDHESFNDNLKRYSHRIGLNGVVAAVHESRETTYMLEGCRPALSSAILLDALASYPGDKFQPYQKAAAFIHGVSTKNSDPSLYHRYYTGENATILPGGWHQHCIGIGVKYDSNTDKTYISISNRGGGSIAICATEQTKESVSDLKKAGTILYEISGKLPQSFFEKMALENNRSSQEFNKALNQELSDAKLIAVLPARPQGHGTCAYVNLKRTIEGFLLIDAISNNKLVNDELLKDVYRQYKLFSVHDKNQGILRLIDYYKAVTNSPFPDPIEIDAINKFAVAIILEHRSNKIELPVLRKLFAVLPTDLQIKLSKLAPGLSDKVTTSNMTTFTAKGERQREIIIQGNVDAILAHDDTLKKLIEYLKSNNLTDKIRTIHVQKDKLTVYTISKVVRDQDVLREVRDDIFKEKLGADVEHLDEMKPGFIVTNVDKLIFPAATPRSGLT